MSQGFRIASRGSPTCVVVGLHRNGMFVARALGRQGVPVVAIDRPNPGPYARTRYARHVACADMRGPGLVDTLRDVGAQLDGRGVLVLTLDRSVLTVSERRVDIEPYFVHSLPPDAVIQRLMSKTATEAFAREHGFSVPRTWAVRSEDELEAALRDLTLPAIVKPAVKTVEFVERTPKKAFMVRTADEVRRTYDLVAQWVPEIVLQEWIPGPDTNLVFAFFYFDEASRPLAVFGGRKLRQWIPWCGTACSAEPWDDPVVIEAGTQFFQRSGYRGFGAIEFKIGPDGKYYLIEPTVGRTEHIFALAVANGVNVPYVGYCDMAGLPQLEQRRTRRSRVYKEWQRDFRAAREYVAAGELTWTAWAREATRPQVCGLLALDDPAPLINLIDDRTIRRARRVQKRLSRRANVWVAEVRQSIAGNAARRAMGGAVVDPGRHLGATIDWLCAAQDAVGGNGVSRAYTTSPRSGYVHLGWQPAYPETTGYIIPTLFSCATRLDRPDLASRATRLADWLVSVQHPAGGFTGGTVNSGWQPVVFNTGMVLQGLLAAFEATRDERYLFGACRAADFLMKAQSRDGAWRRFSTRQGALCIHAFDALVCVGLVEAARLTRRDEFREAAVRNLDFTLTLQRDNGWFASNALRPHRNAHPPTHTIGYVASGLLTCGQMLDERRYVDAARLTADAVMERLQTDGWLPGELGAAWETRASWCCLTGNAQMAVVWSELHELTGQCRYASAAERATRYVLATQDLEHRDPGVRGGVAGSEPFDAPYGRFQFLNWAAKFLADAVLLQMAAAQAADAAGPAAAAEGAA